MKSEYFSSLNEVGYKYMHKFMYQSIDYSITPNANIFDGKIFFLGRNAEAFVLKTKYVWSKTLPYSEEAQQVYIKKLNLLQEYPTFYPNLVLQDNLKICSKNICLIENQILNAKSQILYQIDKLQFQIETLNNKYLIFKINYLNRKLKLKNT